VNYFENLLSGNKSKKELEKIALEKSQYQLKWLEKNKIELKGNDLEKAYQIISSFLVKETPDFTDEQLQIIEKDDKHIIYRFTGVCPWLNACTSLALKTSDICPIVSAIAWTDTFKRKVNDKLALRIVNMRPDKVFCDEEICLGE